MRHPGIGDTNTLLSALSRTGTARRTDLWNQEEVRGELPQVGQALFTMAHASDGTREQRIS
jgi:hypothetical protein